MPLLTLLYIATTEAHSSVIARVVVVVVDDRSVPHHHGREYHPHRFVIVYPIPYPDLVQIFIEIATRTIITTPHNLQTLPFEMN